ncbi:MAG: SpoVR family protein [Planctomycetota bacterium]
MAFDMRRRLPEELARAADEIEALARSYGLDFMPISFELLDHDQLNEVAAFGGFPTRYPHWKWGMEFEQLAKSYEYGLSKIYELVINNDPCYAYLMKSNSLLDQKLVMAHVCGHADFFKHNLWFAHTNRKMMDQMANHGTRIRRYAERHGHEPVERFIDACLSIENLIDIHSPFIQRRPKPRHEDEEAARPQPKKLRSKDYMDRFVNPPEFLEEQQRRLEEEATRRKKFPEHPERDVMHFLLKHAPLDRWQKDVLGMLREEAYYFAPQAMTKIMNEGWACVVADTPVVTERGLIDMAELVAGEAGVVFDGARTQEVYDRNVIPDHPTVRLTTRRGLVIEGSTNHRLLLADGETWRRLDELAPGDRLSVGAGAELWPEREVELSWSPRERVTLDHVAERAGVSVWTVLRHRAGRPTRRGEQIDHALGELGYEDSANLAVISRPAVRVPEVLDEDLGALLGYLVGAGHISRVKRHFGLTSGDLEQAERFAELAARLFEVEPRVVLDGERWRVFVYAETVSDFLVEALGLTTGPSAAEKQVPRAVLRSPEPVVRAFLRGLFDADGYAGRQGVILSSKSERLSRQVQLLLLNYGLLSRRRLQGDGCWHVHLAGASARGFAERVGFGLQRKQEALAAYLADRRWYKAERADDEVLTLEPGRADVYDISVRESHRYAAAGLINHNSFWHSRLMTQEILTDAEVIDYADRHAGTLASGRGQLNPYKIGIELFRDIEERWNKGRFGPAWDACDDLVARKNWDKQLGLGREKVFEVRRIYNDVLFIDEFLTPEFAAQHKMFTFEYSRQAGDYVIASREFQKIKTKLLDQLTNWGNPVIWVEDGNFENRGELYLKHRHDGVDLRLDWARDVLENIHSMWTRPIHLETEVEGRRKVVGYDGKKHHERAL